MSQHPTSPLTIPLFHHAKFKQQPGSLAESHPHTTKIITHCPATHYNNEEGVESKYVEVSPNLIIPDNMTEKTPII
jgi:hypothetical protein